MLMLSLEYYVIGNAEYKDNFLALALQSKILDKDDFLNTKYFVGSKKFSKKGMKGDSSFG